MADQQAATEGAHWRIHPDWIELAVDDDSKGAISGFAATPAYPAYWLLEGEDGMLIGRADTLAEACAKIAEAAGVVLPSPLALIEGLTSHDE